MSNNDLKLDNIYMKEIAGSAVIFVAKSTD